MENYKALKKNQFPPDYKHPSCLRIILIMVISIFVLVALIKSCS
jgi:hypothetical protein